MQRVPPSASPRPATGEAVLSKAVVRATRLPGLTQRKVAEVPGACVATASRLFAGNSLDGARGRF